MPYLYSTFFNVRLGDKFNVNIRFFNHGHSEYHFSLSICLHPYCICSRTSHCHFVHCPAFSSPTHGISTNLSTVHWVNHFLYSLWLNLPILIHFCQNHKIVSFHQNYTCIWHVCLIKKCLFVWQVIRIKHPISDLISMTATDKVMTTRWILIMFIFLSHTGLLAYGDLILWCTMWLLCLAQPI